MIEIDPPDIYGSLKNGIIQSFYDFVNHYSECPRCGSFWKRKINIVTSTFDYDPVIVSCKGNCGLFADIRHISIYKIYSFYYYVGLNSLDAITVFKDHVNDVAPKDNRIFIDWNFKNNILTKCNFYHYYGDGRGDCFNYPRPLPLDATDEKIESLRKTIEVMK